MRLWRQHRFLMKNSLRLHDYTWDRNWNWIALNRILKLHYLPGHWINMLLVARLHYDMLLLLLMLGYYNRNVLNIASLSLRHSSSMINWSWLLVHWLLSNLRWRLVDNIGLRWCRLHYLLLFVDNIGLLQYRLLLVHNVRSLHDMRLLLIDDTRRIIDQLRLLLLIENTRLGLLHHIVLLLLLIYDLLLGWSRLIELLCSLWLYFLRLDSLDILILSLHYERLACHYLRSNLWKLMLVDYCLLWLLLNYCLLWLGKALLLWLRIALLLVLWITLWLLLNRLSHLDRMSRDLLISLLGRINLSVLLQLHHRLDINHLRLTGDYLCCNRSLESLLLLSWDLLRVLLRNLLLRNDRNLLRKLRRLNCLNNMRLRLNNRSLLLILELVLLLLLLNYQLLLLNQLLLLLLFNQLLLKFGLIKLRWWTTYSTLNITKYVTPELVKSQPQHWHLRLVTQNILRMQSKTKFPK